MSSASWYRAPSLTVLLSQINQKWPARSKSSDGTLGDLAHSARLSDHNPNSRRSVNAIDVTAKGIDPMYLLTVAANDRRVNYVIFNRLIYRRKTGFRPERYKGPNSHTMHVHISLLQEAWAEQDTSPWQLTSGGGGSAGAGAAKPGLPNTGDRPPSTPTTPPTPTGGLTVSEANDIINLLTNPNSGLPYVIQQGKANAQTIHDRTTVLAEQNRAIAVGAFGRAAINARNADTAYIVEKAIAAALGQVPGVDHDRIDATVRAATTAALKERDATDADAVIAAIVKKLED